MHKRHVLHLEGHQTARVAKTIDSLCWTGKASYKVGVFSRHGRDLVENVTNEDIHLDCTEASFSSTWEFRSIQHRSRNQLTTDSHSASYKSIHSFTRQLHTSDLEICVWSQLNDTISHTQGDQKQPCIVPPPHLPSLSFSATDSRLSIITDCTIFWM